MKYGVFSDIHGDIEKLERFFNDCKNLGVDSYICLGDIIHKGEHYSENRCVGLIREKECITLRGNHDSVEVDSKLSIENIEYIFKLPLVVVLGDLVLFHDSLIGKRSRKWNFKRANEEFLQFPEYHANIGICGNTHYPFSYIKRNKGQIQEIKNNIILLNPNSNYILNPGTLTKKDFGILDLEKNEFEFLKLSN